MQGQYPVSVDPKDYLTYNDYKDPQYCHLPVKVPEPKTRRVPIWFPGPITVNGRDEFYIESIYQQGEYVTPHPTKRAFIVIWAGWPTSYATIEPECNVQECVALDLFEEAAKGNLVGTGAKRLKLTALRSQTHTNASSVVASPALETNKYINKWPADDLDQLFEQRIKHGIYKKKIGFFSTDRSRLTLFNFEYDLWSEAYLLINQQAAPNYYISPAIHGNYFGRGCTFKETKTIDSSKLCTTWNVIEKRISEKFAHMQMQIPGEKFAFFLFVSQCGDFQVDMNKPKLEGEPYKTHAGVFVAHDQFLTGETKPHRSYFYYEPTYHNENQLYTPMYFLKNQRKLRFTNVVKIIFGEQINSHDCYYRCIRWVSNVINGKVSLQEYSKTYQLDKRNGGQ